MFFDRLPRESAMPHVNPVQIQKYLRGVDYPASKSQLLENARSMGADENVCASLEQLPDEDFQTPADVSQAFGRLQDDVTGSENREKKEREGSHRARPAKGHEVTGEGKDQGRTEPAQASHSGRREQRYTGGNEFLVEAMQDSMAEVRICELAIQKSENPDVKKFAQHMVDEHGRMGRELAELAASKEVDAPRAIRPEQKMTVDELSALNGRDFEQRWIQYNIDVHERDIKVFRHYAQDESDRDIAAMAKKHGDTLGKHLKAAHDLGKKLAKA
jgi:predicted outer membrane protein